MEFDDSDIPDASQSLNILPYQYEPLREVRNNELDENSTSSVDSDIDNSDNTDRLINTDWCECGSCSVMNSAEECVCCGDIPAVRAELTEDLQCITEHEAFIANCLNRYVLQVCMYEYVENVGPLDDNEPINECYRYLAYRRFIRWIWHRLGRHYRKVIPSCVVLKIRETFPSELYCGFKYARV